MSGGFTVDDSWAMFVASASSWFIFFTAVSRDMSFTSLLRNVSKSSAMVFDRSMYLFMLLA